MMRLSLSFNLMTLNKLGHPSYPPVAAYSYTQEEYDKFYESTVNNNSFSISKETLKQNLLQIVNKKKKLKITKGYPCIREILWRMDDNPTAESALDMIVLLIPRTVLFSAD